MSSPSDAPVRTIGTRTRSGNAMLRTRAAILEAAARCVERGGVRKTTMSDVSAEASVAKATLYNHFRTKDDLMSALVLARIVQLTAECSELAVAGLAPALEHAGTVLGASGPLRRLSRRTRPAIAAALATPGAGRLWDAARGGVETVLREAGAPSDAVVGRPRVLRWLCGHVLWAATEQELALGARVLAAGLARTVRIAVPDRGVRRGRRPAGVGWPT